MSNKLAELPVIWVIDELEIVHTVRCRDITEPATDYKTKARTATDLMEQLARPDTKDGHAAPTTLVHCDECIVPLIEMERNR